MKDIPHALLCFGTACLALVWCASFHCHIANALQHNHAPAYVCLLQALRPLLERLQVDLSGGRRSAAELAPVVRRVFMVLEDCKAVVNEWCEGGAGAGAVSWQGLLGTAPTACLLLLLLLLLHSATG
jgi:hypothetical protein